MHIRILQSMQYFFVAWYYFFIAEPNDGEKLISPYFGFIKVNESVYIA